ncbi:DUF937 domain-containing protein [Nonomuraea rhodomycinica]|uniref:DUF937 domain-containing protein n=1 Tax=Nonomuraea rhodomycinica TaxID=1712872 RepID=A0A7Y6IU26_9ACTN|nr:DUF937 domain-containing protein [Nonomuraea rhodomycinica]NUW43074.1 DUF937 domain-containing protein [Nonomuraea rhodomycinica]
MTLTDEILDRLGDPGLEQFAGMLGTCTATTRTVLQVVTGTIVGGMARNADDPDGAEALRGALEDHVDADPFNGDIASLTRDGQSILGHVLGAQGTEQAAAELSRLAGADPAALMKILPLVAPMVMSVLACHAAEHDMEARDVADVLHREQAALPLRLTDFVEALLDGVYGPPAPLRARTRPRPQVDW